MQCLNAFRLRFSASPLPVCKQPAHERLCSSSSTSYSSTHRAVHTAPVHAHRSRPIVFSASAVAEVEHTSVVNTDGGSGLSTAATSTLQFAMNFAQVSKTYEVHSWMILLGLLKQEKCVASVTLQDLGLTDLYAAWHEVLWALNVADGLKPRAWKAEVTYCPRAYAITRSAECFAAWAGRGRTESQDFLMALAAGAVLDGLFPDIDLSFDRVREAVEKRVGVAYELPDDEDAADTVSDAAAELVV